MYVCSFRLQLFFASVFSSELARFFFFFFLLLHIISLNSLLGSVDFESYIWNFYQLFALCNDISAVVCPSLVKWLSFVFFLPFGFLAFIFVCDLSLGAWCFNCVLASCSCSCLFVLSAVYLPRCGSLSSANIFCIDICTFVIRITNSI